MNKILEINSCIECPYFSKDNMFCILNGTEIWDIKIIPVTCPLENKEK